MPSSSRIFGGTVHGWWLLPLTAGMLLLAVACSTSSQTTTSSDSGDEQRGAAVAEGAFVGRVDGTEALVGLVANGEAVVGYVCDGDQVSVWLRSGAVDGGQVTLVGRDGSSLGSVSFTEDQASGEVAVGGVARDFTLAAAEGDAGLYRGFADVGDAGRLEAGWILLADGTQVGGVNESGPDASTVTSAPRLGTGDGAVGQTRSIRGVELAVDRLTTGFIEKTIF